MDPVKLKLAPEAEASTMLALDSFESDVVRHRDYIKEHPDSGYVIVTYRRPGKGRLVSNANFFLNDPMDAFPLPEFVAERIRNMRDD